VSKYLITSQEELAYMLEQIVFDDWTEEQIEDDDLLLRKKMEILKAEGFDICIEDDIEPLAPALNLAFKNRAAEL